MEGAQDTVGVALTEVTISDFKFAKAPLQPFARFILVYRRTSYPDSVR